MPIKPEKYANIFDVARCAGVSTATVSRALNHPDVVKADTRRRIEKAILETGYIRNRAAQAIHGKKSGTIGLIVPTLDNAIFAKLIQAFSDELRENGFSMLVATHDYDLDREFDLVRTLLGHRVEGVALIGLKHRTRTLNLLEKRSVPVISLWSYSKDCDQNCIGGDNFLAGQILADHVVKIGTKSVVTIFPDGEENDRVSNRFEGVIKTLARFGISVPTESHLSSRYSVAEARQRIEDYIFKNDLPDTFIAGNDVIAQGVISALLSNGISVPDQVSVVGFGDFSSSADIYPSITTIRMNPAKVGILGSKELIALIHSQHPRRVNIEVPVELIVRESSESFS